MMLERKLVEMLMDPLDEKKKFRETARQMRREKSTLNRLRESVSEKMLGTEPTLWSFRRVWKKLLEVEPTWNRLGVDAIIIGENKDRDKSKRITLAATACSHALFRMLDQTEKGYIDV